MKSESKTLKHSLKHWGIWLFILIALNFCVIFWVVADGLSVLFDRSKIEETQEGSEDETDTSTESEIVSYPESAIKIDSYEQKMTYFRNWCLYFLFIPEQLGDQCTVSVKLPELNGENGGWQEYLESVGEKDWLSAFYFRKGNELYYSDTPALTWEEEVLFKEQKTLYLDNVRSNSGSFSVRKTDEIIDEFENNYLMISGELKQEIYEPNTIALKYWKWGGLMEVVGFWHMEQTGQCFGTLRGDIYVADYSDNECWICIDGLDPVKFKVPSMNLTLRLTELPAMIENVEFDDAEKEKIKARLSFDLKVESLNDIEAEDTPTEAVTEATEFTEWIPVIRYPEGAIIIDDDEQKMMYFRNWYLSYFEIPDELGDSCYISVSVPWLEGKYGKRSASVRLYYQKEDTYYRSYGELGWDEGVSLDLERRTVYLHDVKHNAAPYNFEQIDLIPENNDGQTTDYLQISGNLSQEIYPAGQNMFGSNELWANILEAVGFWHGKQTGELFGDIKGEVYIMNAESRECWICLEGMEPVRILHTNTSWYRMKEAYAPIEGVEFTNEEKSGALARLSFDLKVESLKEK